MNERKDPFETGKPLLLFLFDRLTCLRHVAQAVLSATGPSRSASQESRSETIRIQNGSAQTDTVYIKDQDVFTGQASGMVFNDLTTSASDDGDTTVSIDADLLGVYYTKGDEVGDD